MTFISSLIYLFDKLHAPDVVKPRKMDKIDEE